MFCDVRTHYDLLIDEGNDPVLDPPALRDYMNQWDGDAFFDLLSLNGTQHVLEIGVGTGRLALRTAPLCASLTGIDLSEKTLSRARAHLSAFKNVTLVQGDFLTHDFKNAFDVIYSSLTFMHLPDKQRAIDKVVSALRPGGRFVLSIDKNQADVLDMGTRRVKLYPDSPESITHALSQSSLTLLTQQEIASAYLFAAQK